MDKLVRAVAPRNRIDLIFKSGLLIATYVYFDHSMSMWSGEFVGTNHMRDLAVTAFSAMPFALFVMAIMGRQRKLQLELADVAATDVLTGLRNRRAFFADASARIGDGEQGFVFLADADHFKAVNDTYGHDVGDRCLIEIADRLRRLAGEGHIAGRIGGEEFAIFVPEKEPPLSAQQYGDALCRAISINLKDANTPLSVTLSAGAVPLNGGLTLADAINRADRALYEAKGSGRARCVVLREDTLTANVIAA